MDTKLPLYHWLVVLIPGTALLAVVITLSAYFGITGPHFPISSDTLRVFVFLIAGLLTGELLQAISSITEPLLVATWGGRPSRLLSQEGNYTAEFSLIKTHFDPKLNDEEAFGRAMSVCNKQTLGRSEYFNTLYGYMRSLTTGSFLVLLFTLGLMFNANDYHLNLWALIVLELLVVMIFWYRTKKRGLYYAKEVIMQAALFLKTT